MRSLAVLALFLGLLAPIYAQSFFQSVVTEATIDYANSTEYPPHPDAKGGFPFAASRNEGLAGALHFRGVLSPHASWVTAETDLPRRYLRLAFKEALPIGTIIGSDGVISYLKADAAYPGDVTKDDQWVTVPIPAGQPGERVVPFPPSVTTRALRFSFQVALPAGGTSRSGFGGALILKARLHNLTPEALAFASSQPGGSANIIEATRVQNLVYGGAWTAAPTQDISPDHPQWVVLAWPTAKTFTGLGIFNAFAKVLEIEALKVDAKGHPALAPDAAWSLLGTCTWPIWWRPAYTDAFIPFALPVTTRALRVRITQPLTNENQDIANTAGGSRRKASLGGVMAYIDLANAPVPLRPKAISEAPPIKIPLIMPYPGKLTVAINDATGTRVRNLEAEVDRVTGKITEAWDGCTDAGRMAPPGKYTVKALTHAPLHLAYQATVNDSGTPPWWKSASWGDQTGPGSWLADHAPPNDVTSLGDRTFIGAVIAESGHTILACDLDGRKLWGAKWLETAGAGYLTNDGKKVYSAGEGGWIGNRLFIHEIDPLTFKWRRVTQLDFDTGNTPAGGVSGIAARDGKLYIAFNAPQRSWLTSALATANLDEQQATAFSTGFGGTLLALLRTSGDVPSHGHWTTPPAIDPLQHLRLPFKAPQAVGAFITPDTLEVSALKPESPYPGDMTRDDQWMPFIPGTTGALRVYTAPPGLLTRALRFTFRNTAGKPWQASLSGGLLLSHRLNDVLPGATLTASVGAVDANGGWTAITAAPITPSDPATLIVTWPVEKSFRGLGLLNAFAKRITLDRFTGPASQDPTTAPEASWRPLGVVTPAIRWRPAYSDDYFDAGAEVSTRALRLRIVEPWVNENQDITNTTGGKSNQARLGGLIVLHALGDDPPMAEVPTQRLSVVDIASGTWERHLAVPAPRFPHFDAQGNLLVVSGTQVARVNLADGALTPLITVGLDAPKGIALDAQGNIYVADAGPKVIKVFSPTGGFLHTIGTPGGRQVGAYDVNRLANVNGIALDQRGHLWVTEPDYQPKRTSLWTTDGKYLNEFIGPAQYGGGGAIDPKDKSRFYYLGMEFALNWQTGAWKVQNILTRTQPAFSGGNTAHPVYLNGKQYLVNDPGINGDTSSELLLIGEFRKDRVIPLTVIGNAELWRPFTEDPALRKLVEGKPLSAYSFMWTDVNGDSLPQPDEVTLSPQGVRLNGTYWPSLVSKKLEVQMGNRLLKPVGYTACGAPIYRPFSDATKLPPFPVENVYATAVDSQGRVLINARPVTALTTDGATPWTYPQQWVGIHDSHIAPSPQPGQMIGALGFIGQEEIPGVGPTAMLSGNKGEWYLFTEDGLLAATVWRDYRAPGAISWNFPTATRGMSLDQVTLGEEHFSGEYVRTSDGKYYLVAGHNHNSIAELTGLDTLKRQQATLTLTAADVMAAESWVARQAMAQAQQEAPKMLTIAPPPAPVTPDGDLREWPTDNFTLIGARGAMAVAADTTNLYLAYRVDCGHPLHNSGDDPKMLFKTGDSVDLQIGVNPKASATRTTPVPGDQRLLLTLYNGKPFGMLYQYRIPGTPQAEKTAFSSPWRTEYVDKLVRLNPANIGITTTTKGYAVEAVIPLALLGITPDKLAMYKADFGILSADASGGATQVRTYWANQATGIVSDIPSEIMLTPGLWGDIKFE